jgi:hypothetical protein
MKVIETLKEDTMKHTPGPWRVVKRPEIGDGQIASVGAYTKIVSADGVSNAEDTANAQLIAAAPEMLAALKTAECEIVTLRARLSEPYRSNMASVQRIIAEALAKAEGTAKV